MSKRGNLSWHAFRNPLIAACLILSAVVCFGIFSKALKIQNAYAEEKAHPGILEKKIKKIEEIFGGKEKEREKVQIPEIEPEAHRRILRFLNAARRPEDLMFPPPQEIKITTEEDEHVPLPKGHEDHERPIPEVKPLLDLKLAKRIFGEREKRFPLGFRHIAQLRDVQRIPWDWIIPSFGSAVYGEWDLLPNPSGHTPLVYIHAAMLRTSKVLLVGVSDPYSPLQLDEPELWNPATNTFTLPTPKPTNKIFCSGHSFLSDGKLLVVGGGGGGPAGIKAAWKFDPVAESWQGTASLMIHDRWYPTAVTLGDELGPTGASGRVLVASGAGSGENVMEIYSESTDSFSTLPAIANRSFPGLYPGLHLLPSGQIFHTRTAFGFYEAGVHWSGTPSPGAWFTFSGPTTGGWTDITSPGRAKGMSVLLLQPTYPYVRIMVVGGGSGLGTSSTAQFMNLSTLPPVLVSPVSFPDPGGALSRLNVNAVLLPDGTVFICGGLPYSGTPPNGGRCLLYNPSTDTWSVMANLNYPRRYHSVALLLPSGQVMTAGGSWGETGNKTIEIFSPPYLFKGARPTITSVPPLVHHGATFTIDTPQASDIGRVVLVRPSSVTHQTDTEQRVIQLSFTPSGTNTLSVTAPSGGASPYGIHTHAFAPRGYYMLFILKNNGVPSEAKFIHLH